MVNRTDAALIGADVATSLAVQQLTGPPVKTHDAVENTVSATIWHYALRDTATDLVGGHNASPPAQLAAKAATLMGLKWLQRAADGSQISTRELILYGLSQAGASYVEPYVVAQVGDARPSHARPSTHTPRPAAAVSTTAPVAVPEPDSRGASQHAVQPRPRGRIVRRF